MNNQKVALVTGASSGIGKEIAKKLLSDGLVVYVAARRVEKMQDLESLGAIALKMDITSEADIIQVVETITQENNGVDVLVNNAGFGSYGAVEDTSIDDARYQFEVNLFGLAALTQKVLPHMRGQRSGTIINISSMGGKMYTPLGAWYHATKYALEGWSDCLRLELEPFGIDVVIIEPGIINTEFGDVMTGPMMERSGNSAYSKLARAMEKSAQESYEKGSGSSPTVIADTVARAVRMKKPRPRYAVGSMAKPLIFLRWLLSDRLFDKAVMSQVK
ncbi:oxidoreductase [Tunicatimonas pelagia]|uniref:oxidoreductase n=1 Tax=Tunicatimonas pelagia TaxID=931531 RepID=UPI0026666411|nr:oxidoreductase [Tunicatimonas pelagia]WKN42941.1 oxidoreductase [Tunicatimonas pelagia]